LQPGLQPEMAAAQQSPLFRLSALFLVLAGIGLAALQRSELVSAQDCWTSAWSSRCRGVRARLHGKRHAVARYADSGIDGGSDMARLCVVIIPNKPWKSVTAAIVSAAIIPVAHLMTARILDYPALPWNRSTDPFAGSLSSLPDGRLSSARECTNCTRT
jgi:hypothetical protein